MEARFRADEHVRRLLCPDRRDSDRARARRNWNDRKATLDPTAFSVDPAAAIRPVGRPTPAPWLRLRAVVVPAAGEPVLGAAEQRGEVATVGRGKRFLAVDRGDQVLIADAGRARRIEPA